jgi:protein-histidine pros-kinase
MGDELGLYGLRKDGTEFPVDIALSYVSTKDGIIILSIVRDITEHKRMEEALRVSEEKFRRIFENAAEGIFQISMDGRILAANPACVTLLGYASSDELIASVTDVRKLYAEPGRRLHLVRKVNEEGSVSDYEAIIRRKDGSKIWVSINAHALRDPEDKIVGLEGMVIDITHRKRAQKNFQMLIDGTPDAIIAIERNSNILIINSKTEKLFGYSRLELLGRPYEILVPMRYREKHAAHCTHYFADPSTKIMALHLSSVARCKDGSEFPVEINMSPLDTDEGIIAVIDIRDISEKKN